MTSFKLFLSQSRVEVPGKHTSHGLHNFFTMDSSTDYPSCSLDLTAASRVYLLEPHWNPMIEEQALCRVHRVGQQRQVTTIRYLMRDSFEEVWIFVQIFRLPR